MVKRKQCHTMCFDVKLRHHTYPYEQNRRVGLCGFQAEMGGACTAQAGIRTHNLSIPGPPMLSSLGHVPPPPPPPPPPVPPPSPPPHPFHTLVMKEEGQGNPAVELLSLFAGKARRTARLATSLICQQWTSLQA